MSTILHLVQARHASLDQRVREHSSECSDCPESEFIQDLLTVTRAFWCVVGALFVLGALVWIAVRGGA